MNTYFYLISVIQLIAFHLTGIEIMLVVRYSVSYFISVNGILLSTLLPYRTYDGFRTQIPVDRLTVSDYLLGMLA